MKLLVVLSVIAIGYADKLDRTYLPPRNAATAGGSPGALIAPGIQSGPFGQGLPSGSGSQQGPAGLTQPGSSSFGQSTAGGQPSRSSDFGTSNNGAVGDNGFSSAKVSAGAPGSSYDSDFESRIPSTSSGFGPSQLGTNQAGIGSSASDSFDQGFGQRESGPNVPQVYTPERAQASADRSAQILKYFNENNGDSYSYSYETSNGIAAEEAGEATNGVRAQGGYSYTGDDGVAYSVTYTADENGFQPQGDHLPTPHPIPEEILKSIEENARAAAAGTQEGAYRPEEYESELPVQQYNTGNSRFTQSQGQAFGTAQGFQPVQGQQEQTNEAQNNQFSANQDRFAQRRPNGASSQYGQENQESSGQFNGKSSLGFGQSTQGQNQNANGYSYKQPQNAFGSGSRQGPSAQYRPQTNQGPTGYPADSSSTGFQSNINRAPTGSFNRPNNPSIANSQPQYQAGSGLPDTPSDNEAISVTASNQGQEYQSSFGSPQGSQYRPGNQPFSAAGSTGQGNQHHANDNQNGYGTVNVANQRNQNTPSITGQAGQNQYGVKESVGSNIGVGRGPSFANNQNTQSSSSFGRAPQYQKGGNQPAFDGQGQGAAQFASGKQAIGSSAAAGSRNSQPIQAPYQYNRPGQSFDAQSQRPLNNGRQGSNRPGQSFDAQPQRPFNNGRQGSNDTPSQGIQRGSEQFGGPRQPPSFSPQEGYKY